MASSADTSQYTVDSKTAADLMLANEEPQPSEETGLGTHFTNTYSKSQKENAPNQPPETRLKDTDSTMTTAQLQQAAADAQSADPNILKKLGKQL